MRLSAAVGKFIEQSEHSKSAETLRAYTTDLGILVSLATVNAKDNVLAFTPDLCLEYIRVLRDKGLSPGTVHRRRATLSSFGKWGVRRRLWLANPVDAVDPVLRPQRLPRPFQPDERARLMALELPPRQRVLRALLYYTGLRISPICNLRLGDVSFAPVRFDDLEMPGSLRTIGKGDKEFVAGMHPSLKPVLEDYIYQCHPDLDPNSRLITQENGNSLLLMTAERWTRRWGQDAKVFGACTPHRFRHTFPTALLESGVDIRVIQVLMNHVSLATTQVYTKVANKLAFQGLMQLPDYAPRRAEGAEVTRQSYSTPGEGVR